MDSDDRFSWQKKALHELAKAEEEYARAPYGREPYEIQDENGIPIGWALDKPTPEGTVNVYLPRGVRANRYELARRLDKQMFDYDAYIDRDGTITTASNIYQEVTTPMSFADRIAALKAEQARIEQERLFLENLPQEPSNEGDTIPVIFTTVQFEKGVHPYHYVFIQTEVIGSADYVWHGSGPQAPKGVSWEELLIWLMERNWDKRVPEIKFSYVDNWDTIPSSNPNDS